MTADRPLERALRRMCAFLDEHGADLSGGWLVAVSGGVDSLALLRLATALSSERGLRVEVAHVDHGLRPSSQEEAARVNALARQLGVPCHVVAVKVRDQGTGPEAAARMVRYRALDQLCQARGLASVATGHTMDDQAETVLMRALGGVGLRGLKAMRPVDAGRVRPLLWMRRAETEQLATALGVEPVDDESNRDLRLLRSRLRVELLPQIVAMFGDVAPHLSGIAEEIAQVEQLIAAQLTTQRPEQLSSDVVVGDRARLAALPPLLRARWLLSALDLIERSPRRARASLNRFSELLPGEDRFSLDLTGARVTAGRAEVRVSVRSGRGETTD